MRIYLISLFEQNTMISEIKTSIKALNAKIYNSSTVSTLSNFYCMHKFDFDNFIGLTKHYQMK